ncbi:hypothetical protein BDF19DRAFT_451141 [Syncephalis fuscata]|nr:hypothetical protein BDF19DRAFT_451141 [Syncephalis fuscata]
MTTTLASSNVESGTNNTSPLFPVQLRQSAALIDNVHTELVLLEFHNRLFLIITQLGKLGGLLHCALSEGATHSAATQLSQFSLDESQSSPDDEASSSLLITCSQWMAHPLFGVSIEQQPLHTLYVTQLAQVITACRPHEQRPLLVSIALKPSLNTDNGMGKSRHLLQEVENMLKKLLSS